MGKIRELTTEEKMTMRLDDIIYYENNWRGRDDNEQSQYVEYEHEGMQCDDNEEAATGHDAQYHHQEDHFGHDNSVSRNNNHYNQMSRYGNHHHNYNNQVSRYDNYQYKYRGWRNKNYGSYNQRKGNYNNRWKGYGSPYWNDKMIQKIQCAPRGSVFRRLDLYLPSSHVPGAGHRFYNCNFHFH
ncbi:pH-response regulator protein palF/RIM8 [Frankliniella fusca]|uniref:PH-response regulator protein palF/RIM8 n=1 Tax=Frankliniella fusca TaxID=407009 RepID=A0AAE1LR04_9NEOP|nr:pH-response regulator protein palF/RIM8 [Frankliniella fusca]